MCYRWGPKGYCRGKETNLSKEEVGVARWCEFIKNIAIHKPKIGIWGGEPLVYRGIRELMSYIKLERIKSWHNYKSLAPVKKTGILPNRHVTFCHQCPDYIIGNVFEESFIHIRNSERANKFRNILEEKGLFSICSQCSSLYSITSGKLYPR